jgi:protein tyrosine/serine phosphatase
MSFKFAKPAPPTPVPILPPPFINVPFLANLRDVAQSLPSTSPPTITPQLLYRSADPSNVDLDGLSQVHNALNIRTIFDLRSGPEIANSGSLDQWEERIAQFNSAHGSIPSRGAGKSAVQRIWAPVFQTEDYNPEALALRFNHYGDADPARGFVKAYAQILEHGGKNFGVILRHLARTDVGGTLVHCTAGKDRTGVLVAVLLALIGVDAERIAVDYQLTEIGLADRRPMGVARLVSTGAFGKESEEAAAAAGRMLSAKKESMLATVKFICEEYGSAESYVKMNCGLSDRDIEALRRRFVAEDVKRNGGQAVL